MDFSLGVSPLFEVAKLLSRVGNKPILAGSLARFLGFVYSYCRGEQIAVSRQFIEYLRQEETRKLLGIFRLRRGR
jgi:hypothetical protein